MSIRKDIRASRQPCWLIDYFDECRQRRRKRVYCSHSIAKRKYWKILEEIEKRKLGLTSKFDHTTLGELVTQYIRTSEIDGKSHLTIRRIINTTDAMVRILGSKRLISDINSHIIEEYKQSRLLEKTPRKTRLTRAGLNTELKHNKALFNWAVKMGMLNHSPFRNVQFLKTEVKPVRILSPAELKSLYQAINSTGDRNAFDLVTFYLQTGARRSEILPPKFSWEQVDLSRKTIVLIGKRNKHRSMPLNKLLVEILLNREGNQNPFDLSPDQVSKIMIKYYKLANIKNANVHTLRKTCGSLLIRAGVDIYRVSKWLGHSSVIVTERHYLDLLKSEYNDLSNILGENASEYVNPAPQQTSILSNVNIPLILNTSGNNRILNASKTILR